MTRNVIFYKLFSKKKFPRWNFEKFLIDGTGKPRFRFHPNTPPEDMENHIETLLEELV